MLGLLYREDEGDPLFELEGEGLYPRLPSNTFGGYAMVCVGPLRTALVLLTSVDDVI